MPRCLKYALCAVVLLLLTIPALAQGREPTADEAHVIAELRKRSTHVGWREEIGGWRLFMSEGANLAEVWELLAKIPRQEFRELNFNYVNVTDEMLEILPEFSEVRILAMSHTQCTNKVLDQVIKLPELAHLILGDEFTDEGLDRLTKCEKLTILELWQCQITPEGMKQIGLLTGLQELEIRQMFQMDECLAHLAGLTELTRLELKTTDCSDAGLAHIANFKKMKWLVLHGDKVTDAGLAHLAGMKELERLGISNKSLTDAAIEHLAGFPKLQTFNLGNSQATEASRTKMGQMYPEAKITIIIPKKEVVRQPPLNPNLPPHIAKLMAEQQMLAAQDLRPGKPLLPGYQVVLGKNDKSWKEAHVFLHMGSVYYPPAEAGPLLTFSVTQPGYVGIAASWEDEGKLTDELRAQRRSLGQLVADGWMPIGYADRVKSDNTLDRHFLLTRKFAAGEKYEVLTRLKTAPFLIGPSQQAVQGAFAFIPPTASRRTLEKLPPRDPLAGRAEHDLVMVTAQEDPTPALPLENGYLLAEIARQAIQLAARHELSLSTADTTTGAKLPHDPAPKNRPLEVCVIAMPQSLEVTVLRAQNDKLRLAWKHWYSMEGDERYEQLVERMERESRTQLVEELHSAGFTGQPYAIVDKGDVDAKIPNLLSQMDLVAQFAVIQILHTQIQIEGESPERISALVRAYANLSLLTGMNYTPQRVAWQARSLLYAARLQALWPNSPLAKPTQSYAWALIGRHQTAIKILADLEAHAQPLPVWLAPVAHFCRFDQPLLEKFKNGTSLGALSRILLLESTFGYRDDSYVLQAAELVLETTPDCYLAINAISSFSALGPRRRGPALVEHAYAENFASRLSALNYVPEQFAKSLPELQRKLKSEGDSPSAPFANTIKILSVIRELRESVGQSSPQTIGSGAPGNDVLAAMLDDLVFVHLLWRLAAQKFMLGVPVDEELNTILPYVKDYLYAPALACMYQDERQVKEARTIAQQRFHPADAIESWHGFDDLLQFERDPYFKTIREFCLRHEDATLYDVRSGSGEPIRPQEKHFPYFVGRMQLVAPHMPATIAWRVETDPTFTEDQGKEFARQYKDSAPVLYALGDRFAFEKKYDLAEACWRRYNRLVKNPHGWQLLAEMYLQKGDEELWLDTMERALEQPAQGLEHASINVDIATHYLGKRDYRRALPYAMHSAESYSSFGLLMGAACHEALQDWTSAEQLYRAEAERYPDVGVDWYYFCRRTGQGRRDEAYRLAADFVAREERAEMEWMPLTLGTLYLLEGQNEKALANFQKLVESDPSPYACLMLAQTADRLGQSEKYKEALQQVEQVAAAYIKRNPREPQSEYVLVAKFLLGAMEHPVDDSHPAGVDRTEFGKLLEKMPLVYQLQANYFLASYFAQRDQDELAVEYWLACMSNPNIQERLRTLAGVELLDRTITPDDYREALQKPEQQLPAEEKKEVK